MGDHRTANMQQVAADQKPLQTFTVGELAKNVGERFAEDERPSSDKMLIAIDDYVYDVTKFAVGHPGGAAVLKMIAGQDATEQFYALHNKSVIEKYHDKLCIGLLVKDGDTSTAETDLKLPERDGEDLVSQVPYAEIPMMRENWANQPWWNESHREFLVSMRKTCFDMQAELYEIDTAGKYVPLELAQVFGKCGILACMNGMSVMPVAQKLFEEGKLVLPGGLEPRQFDMWHEYLANQELARTVPGVSGMGYVEGWLSHCQQLPNLAPTSRTRIRSWKKSSLARRDLVWQSLNHRQAQMWQILHHQRDQEVDHSRHECRLLLHRSANWKAWEQRIELLVGGQEPREDRGRHLGQACQDFRYQSRSYCVGVFRRLLCTCRKPDGQGEWRVQIDDGKL